MKLWAVGLPAITEHGRLTVLVEADDIESALEQARMCVMDRAVQMSALASPSMCDVDTYEARQVLMPALCEMWP